ncbi:hypothetical protein [Nannocystis pusilla]|uniref:Uncharacterized protein n=1 Tax=Nannocystis pusilla TaxID=889268 RepID=A0ABS7TRY5_9BACT|nr:hypothetical protein [Nannocystis pusilla]MBZ5710993.1 hypothetical protein [Nannocystis pusilla]
MSRDRVFPADAADVGPVGLVDLLLGLHAALTRATDLVDELARTADASEPDAHAAPLVDALLGVVAFARTFLPVLPQDVQAPTPPLDADSAAREDLLR